MTATVQTTGYVYVLTHARHPGLVKIGQTSRTPAKRAAEMSTGSPDPFRIAYAVAVNRPKELERTLHADFAAFKVGEPGSRGGQEWFRVSPAEVKARIEQRVASIRAFAARVEAQRAFDDWWKKRFGRFENWCMGVGAVGLWLGPGILAAPLDVLGMLGAVLVYGLLYGLLGFWFFGGIAGLAIASATIRVLWRQEVNQAKRDCAAAHGVRWSDPLPRRGQIMGDLSP